MVLQGFSDFGLVLSFEVGLKHALLTSSCAFQVSRGFAMGSGGGSEFCFVVSWLHVFVEFEFRVYWLIQYRVFVLWVVLLLLFLVYR